MRTLDFKARTAIDLLGFPCEPAEFRSMADKPKQDKASYHLKYTPADVARVRAKLNPEFAARLDPDKRKAPSVVLARMAKGGVGKTTATGNLGLACAMQGWRVLMIDGDPQATLTSMCGVDPEDENLLTLRDLILNKAQFPDAVQRVFPDTELYLLPADLLLSRLDFELSSVIGREKVFLKLLNANQQYLKENFDIILVDSPPASSLLNYLLMAGCTCMMCVVALDGISVKSLSTLQANVDEIKDATGDEKPVFFVANGWHPSFGSSKKSLEFMQKHYADKLMSPNIPASSKFRDQGNVEGPSRLMMEYDHTSDAYKRILELSRNIMKKLGIPGATDL